MTARDATTLIGNNTTVQLGFAILVAAGIFYGGMTYQRVVSLEASDAKQSQVLENLVNVTAKLSAQAERREGGEKQ